MKRKSRKVEPPLSTASIDESLHFRLCHSCLHLNESQSEIGQCERCHTYLTTDPFFGSLPQEVNEQWENFHREEFEAEPDEDGFGPSPDRRRGPGLNGLAVRF